jgi:hypothetical protein
MKRSPAYPAINLPTAIARAKEFYNLEKDSWTNVSVAVGHWGYEDKSSRGHRIISSLKQYGLMEEQEDKTGKDRLVRLTQRAKEIVLDDRPDSQERLENIRKAALSPTIFKTLWEKYKDASDSNLAYFLKVKEDFNPKVVDDLIQVWRQNFTYARLGAIDTLFSDEETEEETDQFLFAPEDSKGKRKMTPPPVGYHDYTLSLGKGKDITLHAPIGLTEDDVQFMNQWLKRLDLTKPVANESSNNNQNDQEQ